MLELLWRLIFLALGDDAPSLRLCSSYLSDRILSRIGTLMQKLCAVHSFALTIPADHKRASMSFPGIEVLCINANVFSIWARSCIALHYSASNWLTPKKRACERDLQLSNLGQRSKCRISFSLLQLWQCWLVSELFRLCIFVRRTHFARTPIMPTQRSLLSLHILSQTQVLVGWSCLPRKYSSGWKKYEFRVLLLFFKSQDTFKQMEFFAIFTIHSNLYFDWKITNSYM